MKNILSAVVIATLAFSSTAFAADAPTKPAAAPAVTAPTAKPAANQQHDAAVNINTADAQALTKLKGVGLKKAEAIVAWRKANGNFKTIDQLADVKGIGPKTVEANRQLIRI